MSELVARTGRHQQRYEDGYRLVAGCIPYRTDVRADDECNGDSKKPLEVLMITKQSGHGRIFPKGGWETDESEVDAALREAWEEAGVRGEIKEIPGLWKFKSKSHRGHSPEGLCRAKMFALHVSKELESWPEQNTRQRHWLSIEDACEQCTHEWMKDALGQFALIYRNSTSSEPVASVNTNYSSKLKD